ncbi:YwdI family protein [Gracilibacillus salinarum]|uniref:YwdI family protein n=1 Tax=Gracilibacillus salinarum TaxID=2932255 RepID=A0ABY4GSJ9_9BACI|nr:YwdI family protein [Gracilibacillus salinarum]UOQ87120.1 YwdI family protein [Gracilibacillus salinarum]
MAITNQQILRKIITECEQALHNESKVREHAKAVQSLTDLLLDQDSKVTTTSSSSIDPLEWEKMVGQPSPKPSTTDSKKLKEEDANGDSLLDF